MEESEISEVENTEKVNMNYKEIQKEAQTKDFELLEIDSVFKQ